MKFPGTSLVYVSWNGIEFFESGKIKTTSRISKNSPVVALGISVRARKYCCKNNIRTVGDLLKTTWQQAVNGKNMGPTTANEIRERLFEHGYTFKD